MILQRVVYDDSEEQTNPLYVRCSHKAQVQNGKLWVAGGEKISTDTYMNAFDLCAWKRYTLISQITLVIWLQGKGMLKVYVEKPNAEAVCLRKEFLDGKKGIQFRFPIPEKLTDGILYFEFCAQEDTFLEAEFETDTASGQRREIKISLVICTYKRKKQLEKILDVLFAWNADERKAGNGEWLKTYVIDNASELKDQYGGAVSVHHNPNTGGAGGFSRGMEETVRNLEHFPATHVVLMDDDVTLQAESLYRLRALLTYLREEYHGEAVAGRMFRLDRPYVQYTAAEIWNGGRLRHIGWNQDMTERNCLWSMNRNEGAEYGGWWFACYPIEFIKENRPLPFFLHCDDVEYGLRHGGTPILLNGIQVWHETYEYRQSPVTAYYDTRNSLFVNEIYGIRQSLKETLDDWKIQMTEWHVKRDYLTERMVIIAMKDYIKGLEWLKTVNPEKKHCDLKRKKRCMRIINSLLWRIVERKYKKRSRNDNERK